MLTALFAPLAALFDLWMKALERSACFRALRTEETVYRLAVPVLFVAVLKGTEPVLTAPGCAFKGNIGGGRTAHFSFDGILDDIGAPFGHRSRFFRSF